MITPTPVTAAIAGAFSAIAWPFVWSRWGQGGSSGSIELIIATILVVALPAHAGVLGFARRAAPAPGQVDTALLKRIGAWLVAAVVAFAGVTAWRAA